MSTPFSSDYLEKIIAVTGGNIYWLDKNGVYQGCNNNVVKFFGLTSQQDIIGKNDIDLTFIENRKAAESFRADSLEVIQTGKAKYNIEEPPIFDQDGNLTYFLTTRMPIIDEKGEVYGVVGTSTDITLRKKAELALQESKEKSDAMNMSALQVAHDIRSPLAAIMMLTEVCVEIPEEQRICLREAASRIQDIANQLLTKHGKEEKPEDDKLSPVMVSTALLSVISSKRVEYQHSKITLNFEANADTYFAFIEANVTEFKRMVSNLINNAMEAFESDEGDIRIILNKNKSNLVLNIIDTGRGMSKEKVQQILSDNAVTTEKRSGFGLGLKHAKKMLKKLDAKLNIYSSPNNGTTMEVTFNLSAPPEWMASEINLETQDCIIILDDDQSIHGAWNEIFSKVLKANPAIKLVHFTHGQECIDYINDYSHPENLLLLTDYELIGQPLNGLDVIERTKMQRTILVTSYYEDSAVIQRASHLKTKILPKMLASHVTLVVNDQALFENEKLISVDLVLLDDDKSFTNIFTWFYKSKNKTLKVYHSPDALLEEISLYSKDTKICTDYTLDSEMTGVDVAKILYEKGYNHLYLCTGHSFTQDDLPAYLKLLKGKEGIMDL